MRITVGHILLLGAVGGGIFAYSQSSSHWIRDMIKSTGIELNALVGLFKSGGAETNNQNSAETPPENPETENSLSSFEKTLDRTEFSTELPGAAPIESPITNSGPSPAPVPSSALEQNEPSKPTVKKSKKRRKKKKTGENRKKEKVKTQTVVEEKRHPSSVTFADDKGGQDEINRLLGSYVSLELNTGRVVKGIFQARSKTHYTIQLPGMGPFKYPVDNVKGIQSAQ